MNTQTHANEVTSGDRARWQIKVLTTLALVIEAGAKANLPALEWKVTDSGMLRGSVPMYAENPGRVFHAWVTYLGCKDTRSTVYRGKVHLRAHGRKVLGTWDAVSLFADVPTVDQGTDVIGGAR